MPTPVKQFLLIGTFVLLYALVSSLFALPGTTSSQASATPITGFAWSDTIGWIDLHCENTGSCGAYNFGFEINSGGEITGYAWSENIGWISANGSDVAGCPDAPCSAKIQGGGVSGWLRALSAFVPIESDPEEITKTFTTDGADTFTVPDYETMTVKVWGAGGGGGNAVGESAYGVGEYTGFSFDTAASGNGDPLGITWDGTYFWVVDVTDDEVYKYNSNGTYASFSFDTAASGNGNPRGITWDGTYFWVVDLTDKEVYKYNTNGTYASFSFDTATSGNGNPRGITWDGTYFWVVDLTDKEVYKYNSHVTYASFSFDTAASGNGGPLGITWDGTYFWVMDEDDDEVYQYGGGTSGTPVSGEDGGQSMFGSPTPLVANGGSGGTGGKSTLGTGGAGGSASGGDTNTAGNSGAGGTLGTPTSGGAGGNSPSGGTGGAGGTGDSDGSAGGAPGAGGGGASYNTQTTAGGGGGGGAYSEKTYSAGELTPGSIIDVTVGAGGAGGDDGGSGHSGGAGAGGRIEITYAQNPTTDADGWDGWISLRGTSPDYGVVGAETGAFSGFAWGSDVVGWVDFAGAYTTYTPCSPTYFCSADDQWYRNQFCSETFVQTCSYLCSSGVCVPLPPPTPTENEDGNGNLKVIPQLVRVGGTTNVIWNVEFASLCIVSAPDVGDEWTGNTGNYESKPIPFPTVYSLDCTGDGGELHQSVTVNIVPVWQEI